MSAKKKPEPAAPAAQEPQQEEKGADSATDSQPDAKSTEPADAANQPTDTEPPAGPDAEPNPQQDPESPAQEESSPTPQAELPYPEWAKLVGGLMDNTPLGRVVAVRGETDRKKLAAMGPWAQRIHQQWQAHLVRRALETTPPAALRRQMDSLEAAMAKLFGGEP